MVIILLRHALSVATYQITQSKRVFNRNVHYFTRAVVRRPAAQELVLS